MSYRVNQNKADMVDPESLRPEVKGFWRKFAMKLGLSSFMNLCSEKWFREWCGGTWVKSSAYYDWFLKTQKSVCDCWGCRGKNSLDFHCCEWLPVIPVEAYPGLYVLTFDEHCRLKLVFDVREGVGPEVYKSYYDHLSKTITELKPWLNKMLPETLEQYPYNLMLRPELRFHPSFAMVFSYWPDWCHLDKLGIIVKN